MDGMESFNEDTQRAKYKKLFGGGPFNKVSKQPVMPLVDAKPASVNKMLQDPGKASMTVVDTWNTRHSRAVK